MYQRMRCPFQRFQEIYYKYYYTHLSSSLNYSLLVSKVMSIHDSPSYIDLQNVNDYCSIKCFNGDFKSNTLMTTTL